MSPSITRVLAVALLATAVVSTPLATGAAAAPAQFEARVAGEVTDPEGNPVVGALITLTSVTQGREFTTETDEAGEYFRRGIRPDDYVLRVEAEGYRPEELEVRLDTGVNTIDVVLQAVEEVRAEEAAGALTAAYERGYAAFQAGDHEVAVAAMDEVLAGLSDGEESLEARVAALTIRGRSQLALGRHEAAVETFERLVETKPEDPASHSELGQAYADMEDYERAREHFGTALELAPDNPDVRYNLGVILLDAGDTEAGMARIQEALEMRPSFALAHKTLGLAQARNGDYAAALEHLRKYLELAPEAPDAAEIQQFIEALEAELQSS